MNTLDTYKMLCRYNGWMNDKIYAVCADMPDEIRKADKGAFFKSIHGTLNHLLLADRLWLGRFSGQLYTIARSLDQELYADFPTLRRERARTDAELAAYIDSLTEERIAADLTFTSMTNPTEFTMPLWTVLTHVFNHQTHHRGQITTIMEQNGYDSGITDLMAMARM